MNEATLHTHEDLIAQPELRDKLVAEWDIVEEIDNWVSHLRNHPVPWTTTIEWGRDRQKGVFHPSSLSKTCDMFLYLELLAADEWEKINSTTLQIFDTGTVIHEQLQYYFSTRALAKDYGYLDEVPVSVGSVLAAKLRMGGHCDGFMERVLHLRGLDLDLRVLFEFKTIKTELFAKLRSKPDIGYVRQTQAYMAATGVPLTIILYYNKNNSLKKAFFVFFDPKVWEPIQERLVRLVKLADDYELPDRNVNKSCTYCKFFKECDPHISKRKGAPRLR